MSETGAETRQTGARAGFHTFWTAAIVGLALIGGACEAQTEPAIEAGNTFTLASSVLGEDRPYWVSLPESYTGETYRPRGYPVLYLLDARLHFSLLAGIVKFMSEGGNGNHLIPEVIVVGIPNTDRTRDLSPTHSMLTLNGEKTRRFETSGGGDAFLRFVDDELIPHIESRYRVLPHRTYVGHSFGGLSVLSSLLKNPELFHGYISIDPALWWDDQVLVRRAEASHEDLAGVSAAVFISQAGYDVSAGPFDRTRVWDKSIARFARLLEENGGPDLDSALKIYKHEDHGSVPLPSFHDGLLHVFNGYRTTYTDLYQGAEYIESHFDDFSSRLGFEYLPPEEMIDRYALHAFNELGETAMALEYLEMNLSNYPASPHAYLSLAKVYEDIGDHARAQELRQAAGQL